MIIARDVPSRSDKLAPEPLFCSTRLLLLHGSQKGPHMKMHDKGQRG
jgi:hypothetical protein